MKRSVERPQLLVCGSRKLLSKDSFKRLVLDLGKRLVADTKWRILTGGYGSLVDPLSTVDELVVSGAASALSELDEPSYERVVTILPDDHAGNNYFRYGRTIVVADAAPRQRRAEMVRRADVVLAIGGGSGSADIIDQAYAADKPLLPLAFTGGAAAEVWERYRALLIKRYVLTASEVALIENGGANRSLLIRRLIRILDRMNAIRVAPISTKRPSPRIATKTFKRKQVTKRPAVANGKLRLVIASPGDVEKERKTVRKVVGEINRGVAVDRGIEFQVVAWETDTYPGFHPDGPQPIIDGLLRIEDCDLMIAIFWKRFGTPVKDAKSGTEHEIRKALRAWQLQRKPDVMLYFSTKPYSPKNSSETQQWTQVLEFRAEFQTKGLLSTYQTQKQFEDSLRDHLTLHVRTKYPLRASSK